MEIWGKYFMPNDIHVEKHGTIMHYAKRVREKQNKRVKGEEHEHNMSEFEE
jgi:hypothetical protein